MKFEIVNEDQLADLSHQLIELAGDRKIWLFKGEMGAGKTTLIKSICRTLGVTSEMSSPTFSIVNEYKTQNQQSIYHFDLYRLKNPIELRDIGFEEYLHSGNHCFIEWPEMAKDFLEESVMTIQIIAKDHLREITVN